MLFCFDFDQTIVKGHFNNLLIKAGQKPNEVDLEIVKQLLDDEIEGFKNLPETRETIQTALSNGHQVAIVSYNQFSSIYETVFHKMGLTEEESQAITVISFLPKDQTTGKTEHLRIAMEKSNVTEKSQVYLIDDSRANSIKAEREGFNTVRVPEAIDAPPIYLKQLEEHIQTINTSLTSSIYILDLSEVMLKAQNKDGPQAARNIKKTIFQEMQRNGQVPPGDNIREIPNYEPGKTFITSLTPMTPQQIDNYLTLANNIELNITSSSDTKESSSEYAENYILNLEEVMLRTQNLAGRDSASRVKQAVYREMQKNDLVSKGENVRAMNEYLSGQTAIKSLLPLDSNQISQYLNFANEVASRVISEKSTSRSR